MAHHARKTEHGGAKNGGGEWCRRVEAKADSRIRRRQLDKVYEQSRIPINKNRSRHEED